MKRIINYWNNEALLYKGDMLDTELVLDLQDKIVLKVDGWNEGIRKGVFDLDIHLYEQIIITDISDVVLKQARDNNNWDINYVIADIRLLPFKNKCIDYILDISTSDHLKFKEFIDIIYEYVYVLGERGEVIIIFNKYNLFGKIIIFLRKRFKNIKDNASFVFSYRFKVKDVLKVLNNHFEIIEECNFGSQLMSTYKIPSNIPERYFYMSYLVKGEKK